MTRGFAAARDARSVAATAPATVCWPRAPRSSVSRDGTDQLRENDPRQAIENRHRPASSARPAAQTTAPEDRLHRAADALPRPRLFLESRLTAKADPADVL